MKRFNFYLAASVSAWLLAALVMASELVGPFKELLKALFTHHWVGKVLVVTAVFVVSGFLLSEKKSVGTFQAADAAWYSVLGSLGAIFLFFLIEFLV